MLNTPVAATLPAAGPASAPASPDATAVFAALLAGTPVAGGPTADAGLPTPVSPGATAPGADPSASTSQPILPHVLEQLEMAAPGKITADVGQSEVVNAGLVIHDEAPEDDQPDQAIDSAMALVDISGMLALALPAGPAPVAATSTSHVSSLQVAATTAAETTEGAVTHEFATERREAAFTGSLPAPFGDTLATDGKASPVTEAAIPFSAIDQVAESSSSDSPGPINGAPPTVTSASPEVRASHQAGRPIVLPQIEMPHDPAAGFDEALGARMAVALDQGISHARIRVNPEHLGAIDMQIAVEGDKVTAQFHSQHADVRAALEGSLVRLRDQLAEQGFQLAGSHVGSQSPGTGNGTSEQGGRHGHGQAGDALDGQPSDAAFTHEVAAPVVRSVGLVDEYA